MGDHVRDIEPEERAGVTGSPSPGTTGVMPRVVAGLISLPLFLWAFFATAGGFGWVDGWIYLGLLFVGHGLGALWVRARNPGLLRQRGRIGEGTRAWDLALLGLFALGYLGSLFVAAAEAGRRDAPLPPGGLHVLGALLLLASIAVVAWSMAVNPHFEKTARIQRDRGHRVVDSGPYRFVRHPGYLALILGWVTAPPLLLGSSRAFLPAALAVAALVVRTYLEDRMLRRELDGYERYAGTVRSRLLPGIW